MAIQTFKCRETEKVFNRRFSRKLPQQVQRRALMKLIQLDSAGSLEDMRLPLSNQLEALQHDRLGQHSVRINRQYRLCFKWIDGNAIDVEIIDYH